MRFALFIAFAATAAMANTLTNPGFGLPETNCNYTQSAPYTTPTCPVVGDPAKFDIQSISVSITGTTVFATIDFNYGGAASLAPYQLGSIQLQPGDLFFYDPSDPSKTIQYGVAIDSTRPNSHNFVAGDLYMVGGAISVETAQTALGNPNAFYRVNQPVLMVDNSGTPTIAGAGNGVQVSALGNGVTAAEYSVSMQFTAPAAFLTMAQNGLGVEFSSADCGNAVLQGVVATPEPADGALVGMGIAIIGMAQYWRKKSAKRNAK